MREESTPEEKTETTERRENLREWVRETGKQRDGSRIDGVMVTAVDAAEFAASLQLH